MSGEAVVVNEKDGPKAETVVASEAVKVRYHGLDALRAWAMSLGIVLHAAWMMTPGDSGGPKTDASASPYMAYLDGAIHMFRMQLFFVLAGFFACLLVRKRGPVKFALNRVLRVAVPLVLFWIILRPLMTAQFYGAKIQSGEILGDNTAWGIVNDDYANMTAETVFTMHLWFIYYLFLAYVLVLSARTILAALDRDSRFRNWVADAMGSVLVNPWSFVPLAVLTGVFMLPMGDFSGIEMDAFSLYPLWSGLLCYTVYFVVGWIIFRNLGRLAEILRGWHWQLMAGVLLTIPYYFFLHHAIHNGYQTSQYPALTTRDMRYDQQTDKPLYAPFREKLLSSDQDSIAGEVWQLLPEPNRLFLEQHETATENQIAGLLTAINSSVLASNEFSKQADLVPSAMLSPKVQEIQGRSFDRRNPEEVQLLNREVLQWAFSDTMWTEDIHRPNYVLLRVAYSFLYSMTTWLLIFGCLGFTQAFFQQHSRFWRYYSDAAYWMYLMHLLIQFQILLWVGDLPWHWALKFGLYVVGTLAVLVPTYHLFVRPTWIGWLLNGRTYPIWNKDLSTEAS